MGYYTAGSEEAAATVSGSFATGNIVASCNKLNGAGSYSVYMAGLIGYASGSTSYYTISSCYRLEGQTFTAVKDGNVTNGASNAYGSVCTADQLSSKEFFLGLGWNEAVWDLSELSYTTGKYPVLKA